MKKPPFRHQIEEFDRHWMDPWRAIHWEQGTGKTYLALWMAEELFKAGKIDCLFVLAPNGLHTNWVLYEIPELMSIKHQAFAYQSKRAKTKKHSDAVDAIYHCKKGLPILTMAYDAIKTPIGKKTAQKFLKTRRCFYVIDESNRIKTPGAAVTKTVVASGRHAEIKRTLCGTPITNTPFDIYTQLRFLYEDYWRETPYGLSAFEDFKTFFGIWQMQTIRAPGGKLREFKKCVSYQNIHILSQLVAQVSSRVLKEDVLKDLPPKLYSYKGFEMSPKQKELYNQLETEFMADVGDGEILFTPLAITRMLRLQQVTCGYLPTGEESECVPIDKKNPRMQLLLEITQDLPHKAIIWARFLKDIDIICEALGDKAVRWDGSIPDDEREENKRRFKQCPIDEVQFIVATPESMGEGHTLNEAKTAIYYSNSYKLKERLQSEDRFHRVGQTSAVHIIDLIADNTQDIDIIEALRGKFDSASQVVDGRFRNWLLTYDNQPDILGPSIKKVTEVLGDETETDAYELFR
ncbi:MAG: DEAD/DEAH box helicase [Deltaproteobacteria bacterium]|nr:DEAD/DEAH box helicase [Deltaproteobacteria bacterium]